MSVCRCQEWCLCDVAVAEAAQIADINFATDSLFGKEIFEYLGLSSPLTDDEILRFFEFQSRIKDRLEAGEYAYQPPSHFKDGRVNVAVERAKLTAEMRDLIAQMVSLNLPSSHIRAELSAKFGVAVSASHMSHMRKRVFNNKGTNL